MKIAITGGSGFIGGRLIAYLQEQGHEVWNISRSAAAVRPGVQTVTWDELARSAAALAGVDAIVNLAGESINQRWTSSAKERILQSRLQAAAQIASLVERLDPKPKVVVNASGMSIYGTSETASFDESSPHQDTDFLSHVVQAWEDAADHIQGTRVVKVRVGLVLDRTEGALPKMLLPYKLGVGGPIGSGRQWMSWIHITDMVRLIVHCIEDATIAGPVNATAPEPVTNRDFSRALAKALHRPNAFPLPAFVMKLAFGELSVLLLEGQRVFPKVLLDHGFRFTYTTIDTAFAAIFKK
ncbi:TIGR01777 family oxidoreductase [Paenibacillus oryzisoli]|uniref:TIGR01777 family oxidoreductase n=1 Tax=Paenibacillus oryzisoli TaxID=1850517 RepID=UPI003D2D317F